MGPVPETTIVVGNEFDDRVWTTLRGVLVELGARVVGQKWGLGGSQEIESFDVGLPTGRLRVESETYVGISISGPADLVERVRAMVVQRLEGGGG